LLREFNNMRQVNDSIEMTREEFQRALMVADQEKAFLQDQVRELKRNNDLLVQQFDIEKKRYLQLEEILGDERKMQYRQNLTLQNSEQEKAELQNELSNLQRRGLDQSNLRKDTGEDSFNRDPGSNPIVGELHRTISGLQKKLGDAGAELQNVLSDNRTVKEENSKLRMSVYKLESERTDFTKMKHNQSLGSTFRSSYDLGFGEEMSSKLESGGGLEKLKLESEAYKKSLNDASLSAQYLKERVKNLNREIDEYPDKRKYK